MYMKKEDMVDHRERMVKVIVIIRRRVVASERFLVVHDPHHKWTHIVHNKRDKAIWPMVKKGGVGSLVST